MCTKNWANDFTCMLTHNLIADSVTRIYPKQTCLYVLCKRFANSRIHAKSALSYTPKLCVYVAEKTLCTQENHRQPQEKPLENSARS